jgi:hypothetical protein
MSNGNRSHTLVTQVEIDSGNNIQVSIEVAAFMPGESVEISGYVAQNHGAFANFDDFQTIQTKLGETANLTVTATPVPGSGAFRHGHDVMVFLRAAKVWVTVLGEGQVQQSGIAPNRAVPGTVWGRLRGAAGPDGYSDTQEGNQSGSAPGGAGQEASDGPSDS